MLSGLGSKNKAVSSNPIAKFSNVEKPGENSIRHRENKINRILDNRILGSLNALEAARLVPHLEFVHLKNGEEIYEAGESRDYIYFPETAVISHISDLEDGNAIETLMTGREGASGLSAIFGASAAPARRAAISIEGNAWRVKAKTLEQEFARGGQLQTLLFDAVNRQINQISQRFVCKAFHLIEKRFCSWLLMLRERTRSNHLKLTQETIALLLGANRPSITIAAQTLRKKGLIAYSRGGIVILNLHELKISACECYSFLQTSAWKSEAMPSGEQ